MRDHRRFGFSVTNRKRPNIRSAFKIDRSDRVVQQLIGSFVLHRDLVERPPSHKAGQRLDLAIGGQDLTCLV